MEYPYGTFQYFMKIQIWSRFTLAGLMASCLAQAQEQSKLFSTDMTFETALKQAAEHKKIVFIDFFTTWCGPCKTLDRTTWQDARVISLLREKAIALKIDAEKQVALAQRYQVDAYPTLLLLKPDGSIIDRLVGYRDATKFISEFNAALDGKTSLIRAQDAVASAANSGGESSVQARYQLAQTLAQTGKHAEALKEYLWLFDDGMKREPGFGGVRDSFLLSSIASLGREYPPALTALRERRDTAQAQLEAGGRDLLAAMDFARINGALNDEPRSLALFDNLPATSPARKVLGRFIFDQLLTSRRYADALGARPMEEFTRQFDMTTTRFWGDGASKFTPEMRKQMQSYCIEDAAKQIEALAGAGKLDDARQLIKRLRALDDTQATAVALHQHLDRAGQSKLAEF
jgi:thioredoxin-like negative regulator of GroEL